MNDRKKRLVLTAAQFGLLILLALFGTLALRAMPEPEPEPVEMNIPEEFIQVTPGEYQEYGADTSLVINTSGFVDPGTKNNLDLVTFVTEAWNHQWGYVWGTYGEELTEVVLDEKLSQYPEDVGEYEEFIRANWMYRRTADCVGLIKGYMWFDPESGLIEYSSRGITMPDLDANHMFAAAEESGPIKTIPETPGILVYYTGHVGVYIGGGYVIESRSTEIGVVKTRLDERPFTDWFTCPYLIYKK